MDFSNVIYRYRQWIALAITSSAIISIPAEIWLIHQLGIQSEGSSAWVVIQGTGCFVAIVYLVLWDKI